jgi:hypothetical protein
VVVTQLLAEEGTEVDVRVVQRRPIETAPGHQLQIDFGEKVVTVAGVRTRVTLFVAVLS